MASLPRVWVFSAWTSASEVEGASQASSAGKAQNAASRPTAATPRPISRCPWKRRSRSQSFFLGWVVHMLSSSFVHLFLHAQNSAQVCPRNVLDLESPRMGSSPGGSRSKRGRHTLHLSHSESAIYYGHLLTPAAACLTGPQSPSLQVPL